MCVEKSTPTEDTRARKRNWRRVRLLIYMLFLLIGLLSAFSIQKSPQDAMAGLLMTARESRGAAQTFRYSSGYLRFEPGEGFCMVLRVEGYSEFGQLRYLVLESSGEQLCVEQLAGGGSQGASKLFGAEALAFCERTGLELEALTTLFKTYYAVKPSLAGGAPPEAAY